MPERTDPVVDVARDWTTLPLDVGGRGLIEASAGTGKTWTIAVLYLRLLLEARAQGAAPLTPRQIVVTTFTDAAAQELRSRLRAQLLRAERLATTAIGSNRFVAADAADADAAWLHARWRADGAHASRDLQRLRLALAELDIAPITTLHGLCRRILADHPFESGAAFAAGDMVSADSVLAELTEDLWRRLQQGSAALPAFASVKTLDALGRRLRLCLAPGVGLWSPDAADLERCLPAAWAGPIAALAARKDLWGQKRKAPQALRDLAAWLRERDAPWSAKQAEGLVQAEAMLCDRQDLRDEHAMIVAASRSLDYLAARDEIDAWRDWSDRARAWRDERLAATQRLTFDDLLTRAHTALAGSSRSLADRLFAEWQFALVDEFQDTDALQFAILDRIWSDARGLPRGRLIMIGDPKQAIYRFRGGDIAAYLDASREVDSRLELDTNFRSSRAYVAAVNELFERAGETLSVDAAHPIRVHRVLASHRRDAAPYQAPGAEAGRPLVFHYNAAVPAAAGERRSVALAACANQIAAMLADPRYRIGERAVAPGDIAVLLPVHANVLELRELLQQRRVPCVGSGRSSVFATDWARELQIALYAVEHAGDEGAVRAALATRLGGLDFDALRELGAAPDAWQTHAQRFADLKRRWQSDGVLAVVHVLAQEAMTREPDARARERALTDLRHLGELLQEQDELVHGAAQLLAWLAGQRRGEDDAAGEAAEEQQLRIESDAARVRLMTLHASKGLEFPIVFLPLMWDHARNDKDSTPIIREPLCGRRVIGFGSEAKAQYDREGQDERFRVLYVALTRAIHACHVYVLSPRRPAGAKRNAPPTDPARSALDALVERLLARDPDPRTLQHLLWSARGWGWPRTVLDARPAAAGRAVVVLAEPPRPSSESIWSFSALTRMRHAAAREEDPADDEALLSEPARDEVDALAADRSVATTVHPDLAALAMLRGAEFGNALHAILEQRATAAPLASQGGLIARALREAGVRLGELPLATAVARIGARLDAALAAEIAPGLSLGALPARDQRAEMAFHFMLDAVPVKRLREACADHGAPDLVPAGLPVATLRGFMTGEIDLVFAHAGRFHVLDYKSNHLGDDLAAYAPHVLTAAMDAHHYRFQALLYTIAVDRYLRERVDGYRRTRQLGETIYAFVRAVGLGPAAGVWRCRFDDALLDAVDAVLGGHATQAAA